MPLPIQAVLPYVVRSAEFHLHCIPLVDACRLLRLDAEVTQGSFQLNQLIVLKKDRLNRHLIPGKPLSAEKRFPLYRFQLTAELV